MPIYLGSTPVDIWRGSVDIADVYRGSVHVDDADGAAAETWDWIAGYVDTVGQWTDTTSVRGSCESRQRLQLRTTTRTGRQRSSGGATRDRTETLSTEEQWRAYPDTTSAECTGTGDCAGTYGTPVTTYTLWADTNPIEYRGACEERERKQVRTVTVTRTSSRGGCADLVSESTEEKWILDAAEITTGEWTNTNPPEYRPNRTCADRQIRQTRTVTPAGCAESERWQGAPDTTSAGCRPTAVCDESAWVATSTYRGSCGSRERRYTRPANGDCPTVSWRDAPEPSPSGCTSSVSSGGRSNGAATGCGPGRVIPWTESRTRSYNCRCGSRAPESLSPRTGASPAAEGCGSYISDSTSTRTGKVSTVGTGVYSGSCASRTEGTRTTTEVITTTSYRSSCGSCSAPADRVTRTTRTSAGSRPAPVGWTTTRSLPPTTSRVKTGRQRSFGALLQCEWRTTSSQTVFEAQRDRNGCCDTRTRSRVIRSSSTSWGAC